MKPISCPTGRRLNLETLCVFGCSKQVSSTSCTLEITWVTCNITSAEIANIPYEVLIIVRIMMANPIWNKIWSLIGLK